jgi:hypothetical protein
MQTLPRTLLSLCAAPLLASLAGAQTNLFVNDVRDLPDGDLTDLQPDADLLQPGVQVTLRSAVEFANHQGGSWIVHLPAGLFALDRVGTEDQCRWGDLDAFGAGLSALELRGVPGQSVIDASPLAGQGGPDRVLDVKPTLAPGVEITLRDVVLRSGQVVGRGGGVRLEGGKLVLVDTWIEQCSAQEGGGLWIQSGFEMKGGHITDCLASTPTSIGRGGGAYVAAGAQPAFQLAQINGNQADQRGGGVYVAAGALADFSKCQIDGNRLSLANGGSGGGIAAFGPVTLIDCFVLGNQANLGTGGGVLNSGAGVLGTFIRTSFTLNAAGSGGGMATSNSSAANVVECTFFGNTATNLGGGWSHSGPSTSVLQRSTFQANTAQRGGGLQALATLLCENSTFSGNSAQEGGGLYVNGGMGSYLRSTTIAFNTADLGAGVYMANTLGTQMELSNSILAENLDTNGVRENFAGFPFFAPAAGNFDSDGTTKVSSASNVVAAPNGYIDPLLLPLANNGGPTATHALQAKSWAVGSGVCVSTIDQRGVPRLPPCDIGAYETNLAPPWIATYCTAKPTTIPGCLASMTSAGVPFVGNPASFTVTAQPTPGGNPGIYFWSTTGPAATPFAGGFLCVQSPLTRSSAIPPGGTFGSCNGGYTTSGSTFLQDWSLGKTLWIQCWFRDPGNILDSSFSNALEVTVL